MKLDFFVELKYQSTTIIFSVDIKYSARDLLCYVNYYALDPQCSDTGYDTYCK